MTDTPTPQRPTKPRFFNPFGNWIGVFPFFLFILAFLVIPSLNLFIGAFQDAKGNFTLVNIANLLDPYVLKSYSVSLQISLITSFFGGIFGFFVAYAVTIGKVPRWMRNIIMTFSGLAANFGGVPLAFAFIATIGHTGFLTAILKGVCFPGVAGAQVCPFDIYKDGFNLYSVTGLTLSYMYFQFPLMVLTMAPALEGLRKNGVKPLKTWGQMQPNTGGMLRYRCCYRPFWVPASCCSPARLAHLPPPRL